MNKNKTDKEKLANGIGTVLTRIINALLRTRVLDPKFPMAKENLANTTLKLGPNVIQNLRSDLAALVGFLSIGVKGDLNVTMHTCLFESELARTFCSHMQAERLRQDALHESKNKKHDAQTWANLIERQRRHFEKEGTAFSRDTRNKAVADQCTHELICIATLAQAAYENLFCKHATEISQATSELVGAKDNA